MNERIKDIADINLNTSYFHFSLKDSMNSILEKGLVPQIGDASQIAEETKARVYVSQGLKGLLAIKNSFLYEFSKLKRDEIPDGYRKYFTFLDSQNNIGREELFDAFELRFKDEVYFLIDSSVCENLIETDKSSWSDGRNINCKAGVSIPPSALSLLYCTDGFSAYDIVMWACSYIRSREDLSIIEAFDETLFEFYDYELSKYRYQNAKTAVKAA